MDRAISGDWTLVDGGSSPSRTHLFPTACSRSGANPGITWTDDQQVLLHLTAPQPAFQSAAVDWKTLTMTFAETLDEDSVPSPGAFRVTVNNARRNVVSGGVAVSGQTVTLTLASPVAHGDTVKVRYTRPSARPLQGAGGFFAP